MKNVLISTITVIIIFISFFLFKYSGNITGFFHFHGSGPVSPYLDRDDIFFHDEYGYDGIFYVTMALDPLLTHPQTLEVLDIPEYRYRRMLYPSFGYILSLGNKNWIPYSLVIINILCIIGLVYYCNLYFQHQNESSGKSLIILAIPGIWLVFGLSTAELLASFFLIASIVSDKKEQYFLSASFMTFACLSRETLLLAWFAFIIAKILECHRRSLVMMGIAVVPVLLWNIFVLHRFEDAGIIGFHSFDIPLKGLVETISVLIKDFWSLNSMANLFAFGVLFSAGGIALYRSSEDISGNRVVFLIVSSYILLFSFSSFVLIHHYVHFTRLFLDLFIMAVLVLGKSKIENLFIYACILESVLLIYALGL